MNLDWLKPLYEFVGSPYPRASFVIVVVLGCIAGGLASGAIWHHTAKLVEQDHQTISPPRVSGPASTSGDKSPAVTGDKNSIVYSEPSAPEKKPDPQKKKD